MIPSPAVGGGLGWGRRTGSIDDSALESIGLDRKDLVTRESWGSRARGKIGSPLVTRFSRERPL